MTVLDPTVDMRARGQARLAARRRRFTRIRLTVVGVAAAVFVAFFSTIYVQLANGHDPALSAAAAAAQSRAEAKKARRARAAARRRAQARELRRMIARKNAGLPFVPPSTGVPAPAAQPAPVTTQQS